MEKGTSRLILVEGSLDDMGSTIAHFAPRVEALAARLPDLVDTVDQAGVKAHPGPVLVFRTGAALVDPTFERIAAQLGFSIEPGSEDCDLAIIGTGPRRSGPEASRYSWRTSGSPSWRDRASPGDAAVSIGCRAVIRRALAAVH